MRVKAQMFQQPCIVMLSLGFKKEGRIWRIHFSLSFQIALRPGFHPARRVCRTHFTYPNRDILAYKRQSISR